MRYFPFISLATFMTIIAGSCGAWQAHSDFYGTSSDHGADDRNNLSASVKSNSSIQGNGVLETLVQEAVAAFFLGYSETAQTVSLVNEFPLPLQRSKLGPGDYLLSIPIGQNIRYLRLHIPPSYDGKKSLPLTLVFHGGLRNAKAAQTSFGFDTKADEEQFIVAYPDGLGLNESDDQHHFWNYANDRAKKNHDDIGFIKTLLKELPKAVNFDRQKIFGVGFSAGAMMVHRLGCELSELAAIATVSGTLEVSTCKPPHPLPILMIHGKEDQIVPIEGGGVHGFRPLEETLQTWLRANSCDPEFNTWAPIEDQNTKDATDSELTTYTQCRKGSQVQLLTVDGGGHTWPGMQSKFPILLGEDLRDAPLPYLAQAHALGLVSRDFHATDIIWDFLKDFHRINP